MRLFFCVVLLLGSAAAAAVVDIGVASAVRGGVRATAPGQAAGRVVETGKSVYSHDKVVTGAEGKLQILLLDQTSFTIGPNSEMELDEFVYDPATSAGKVTAKIAKGAFRFVTGKVARRDPSNMQVATPVGTIGIRGTMTAGKVSAAEALIVLLGPGPGNNADEKMGGITIKNEFGASEVDKDGWGVTVKAGAAPSAPFELSSEQIEALLAGLSSTPTEKDDSTDLDPADQSSGQRTAKGLDYELDAFAAIDAAQGEASQFASQQFAAPGQSTWDQVRGIPGGTGQYSGSAPFYNCNGGVCGTSPQGVTSFTLNVNFGARTVGGGGSNVSLTSASGASGTISAFSYAGLGGDAKYTPTIIGASSNWTGTTIKLLNAGGVAAGAASIDVRVVDTFGPNPTTTFGGPVSGTLSR